MTTNTRRPTNGIEWVISIIFLILVLKFGYTTLTVVGLIITMIVLLVASMLDDDNGDTKEGFVKRVTDNNWVYYTMLSLFVLSLVIYLLSFTGKPLPEMNPLKYAWGLLKDTVVPPPVDPWTNQRWGNWITALLLGENGSWRGATFTFGLWTLLARPVSFWDDWSAKRKEAKEKAGHKGGLVSWLFNQFVNEGIGEALWAPFKKKK